MSGNSAFNRDIKITPSILSADFANFGAEVEAIEQQGCDWVHVDVMDGHFVPNITFGPQTCEAIRPHVKTVMDVHFMIAPVDPFIEAFTEAGSDILTAHVEAGPHLDRTLQAIRAAGCKACQALNPATPAESIAHVLDRIDLVCVMTVNPGFGGQSFIQSIVPKVESLREMIGDRPIHIEIDGGGTAETAPVVAAAGADVLVAGSAEFQGRLRWQAGGPWRKYHGDPKGRRNSARWRQTSSVRQVATPDLLIFINYIASRRRQHGRRSAPR